MGACIVSASGGVHQEGWEFGSETACLASSFHRCASCPAASVKPARSCKRKCRKVKCGGRPEGKGVVAIDQRDDLYL